MTRLLRAANGGRVQAERPEAEKSKTAGRVNETNEQEVHKR
jgi:hypothetical protein